MSTQVEQLETALMAAIGRALDSGSLKGAAPESIKLERPKDRTHGDYASSIALQLAKPAGMNPREVAQIIADQLIGLRLSVRLRGDSFLQALLIAMQ